MQKMEMGGAGSGITCRRARRVELTDGGGGGVGGKLQRRRYSWRRVQWRDVRMREDDNNRT
ncbi:uncharacterized protein DS421_16g547960 [Arachis hypogaea]|nr:uncharacterized protein DS421_16g547960 [Arachis hypogaea]